MKSRIAHRTAVDAEAGQKNSVKATPLCKMKHRTWSRSR